MENKKDVLYTWLKERIRLISRGIIMPRRKGVPVFNLQERRGGVGPQGKILYWTFDKSLGFRSIFLPVYSDEYYFAKYSIPTKFGEKKGTLITDDGIILKGVQKPKFIAMATSDGTPIVTLGGMHGNRTYTTNLCWRCRYFEEDTECKFCTIDKRKEYYNLSEFISDNKLIEAIRIATKVQNIRSITSTIATFDDPDIVAERYIEFLKKLKKTVHISVLVQLEPVKNLDLIKELSIYSEAIGIFLEIWDEEKRKEICPGKSAIPKDRYIENWKYAVKYYGWRNVGTTTILGFDEDYDKLIREIEEYAKIGVRTSLIFLRPGSENLKGYVPSYVNRDIAELVDLHIEVAKIYQKYDLDFRFNVGVGCSGCMNCSAMYEAAEYVRGVKQK
ncbi:radical SAM protein [Elusimicrobiota bacterium]